MPRPRVLLADDHTLVLKGLRKLLEGQFDLVGAVSDGRLLLEMAAQTKPDVILLDISMPLLNGIDAARQLRKIAPASKVIFLTMHAEAAYVREAFRAGASGYLLKWSAEEELAMAIEDVLRGRLYLTPLIPEDLRTSIVRKPSVTMEPRPELTMREREVLQLVAEGHAAKQIAAILGLSVKTIEFHKYRVMKKLGERTTAGLTRYAVQHGLLGV